MKSIFVLFFVTLSLSVSSQKEVTKPAHDTIPEKDRVYDFVQVKPEFIGGEMAMHKYFEDNLRFPTEAQIPGNSGICIVRFVVTSEGKTSNAKILRGLSPGCDKEALRLIREMPTWTPGMHNGKNVNVTYSLPIRFKQ